MKSETEKWLEQVKKDIRAANNSFNSRDYEWACFQAHQAVEKSLKALIIEKKSFLIKTHDLVLLAKKLDAPEDIKIKCSKINPSYIDTRYPDVPKAYSEVEVREIVKLSEEVISWIEKNL
ncbi:HEPN domain-containing protein [Candidatus Pacearchaeota archaeon]|nr:HEPN domain-containing protein [Candidatus Pacearchaeota archaeon]